MRLETLLEQPSREFSGVRAKRHVTEIARHHRIQASPGYDDALDDVRTTLESMSIPTKVSSFPADGRAATHGWTAPMAWRIRSGRLTQLAPTSRQLCAYDEVPISVLGQSAPGAVEAELIHVGSGTSIEALEGVDLKGRFVLACGRAAAVAHRIRGRGAAGLVIYPDSARASASYDLVQYGGLFPTADEVDTTLMGFSISRRVADELIGQLDRGPVRLRGEVDSEFFEGGLKSLEAWIPGSEAAAGEVLLVAHLCHPSQSANDNGSGSAVLVELARTLQTLTREAPLRNGVRFLWVPEFHGSLPWAAANASTLEAVHFVINLDMVGQSPELLGQPLRAFRPPNARASVLDACIEPILARISEDEKALAAQGSRRPLHWILDRPSGGSDHLVFQAPPHGLPAIMFGHDDPFWHTDADTLEKVDSTRLKHVGLATGALAALPTWANAEVPMLGAWLLAFGARELSQAAELGQEMDSSLAHELLASALEIERARAESLASLVGTAWNRAGHGEALEAVARQLSASRSIAELPAGTGPRRVLDGPFRFGIMDELNEADRAFFDEKLAAGHRAAVESLLILCDGQRPIEQIALRLALDFGAPFSVEDVRHAVEVLTRAGYLAA